MSGMVERHPSHGPKLTYKPWTTVTGGRLCEPDTTNPGYIQHASAGSTTVVGMAKNDATRKTGGPFEVSAPSLSPAFPVNDFIPTDVVCYDDGVFDVEVTAGPVAEGQRFIPGADGKFAPWDGTSVVDTTTTTTVTTAGVVVARNVGPALTSQEVTDGKRARVRLLPN